MRFGSCDEQRHKRFAAHTLQSQQHHCNSDSMPALDTSAAVIRDGILLSNVTASQGVHEEFGGVVPELASRAHQLNIVPVVDAAIKRAGIESKELSAIAFTRGPGLLGSLLVGTSFAKGMALSLGIPLVEVNHLQAHILAHFITPATANELPSKETCPKFPFLCLLVSGGNFTVFTRS